MPDVVTPTPEPLPEFPMPPAVLGLVWHRTTMLRTRVGARRLSKAWPTAEFKIVWWCSSTRCALQDLGFQREDDGTVVLWGREKAVDPVEIEVLVAHARRIRELFEIDALRIEERLRAEVDAHWWAVPAEKVKAAQALLRSDLLTATLQREADALADVFVEAVARAGRAVAKAQAALSPDDITRCETREVRSAVHEACRVMSLKDDDRAAISNGMGWSKSTSHRGHWLSELPELDAGLAAVGLALVHRHRRQLRDDLRETLFPGEQLRRAA